MPFATPLEPLSRAFFSSAARTAQPPRRNLLRRIVDAIVESNRRKAEREIARSIARNGGRFTDPLETDIAQRFGNKR